MAKKRDRKPREEAPVGADVAYKPEGVRDAVIILYTCACIAVIFAIFNAQALTEFVIAGNASVMYLQWFSYLHVGLLCALAYLMSRGWNWARLAFFGIYALSFPFLIYLLPEVLPDSPGFVINSLFIVLLQAIAVFYLMRKEAVAWFKDRGNRIAA